MGTKQGHAHSRSPGYRESRVVDSRTLPPRESGTAAMTYRPRSCAWISQLFLDMERESLSRNTRETRTRSRELALRREQLREMRAKYCQWRSNLQVGASATSRDPLRWRNATDTRGSDKNRRTRRIFWVVPVQARCALPAAPPPTRPSIIERSSSTSVERPMASSSVIKRRA